MGDPVGDPVGDDDGGVASMAAAYGLRAVLRNAFCVRRTVFRAAVLLGLAATPGARAAAPVQLVVLGDSLAAGYGLDHADGFEARLAAALAVRGAAVRIVDGAVSGATSADGLARLDWVLGGLRAGKVAALVELGANDGLRGLPVRDLRANLTAILDRLAARHIPVLLAGMEAPPNLGAGYAARFRAVYAALGRRPGVVLEPFFLVGVAEVPGLIQADGLHPNPAGVRRVVAAILPYVMHVLRMARGEGA